ncbi:hypothetical protein Q1695_012114 [Nippostrongylus brasiliensis]|nr:hypothetical protein Q1695_012114 [Nippostrongylus brasiliensis]
MSHQPYEEYAVLEEEVAIEEQQELSPGNVGVRREFVVDSPPIQSPVATSRKLAECLENTVLDMLRAAMFINRGRFSTQATYKEFVQAAAASSIIRYDGFEGITNCETYRTLNTVASQFFAGGYNYCQGKAPRQKRQQHYADKSHLERVLTSDQQYKEDVESFLIEFALDMLGYGRDEIKCPAGVQLDESRCFIALQLVLRDIRIYTYGEVSGLRQWIKNKRQRRAEEQTDDGDADGSLEHFS